MKYIPVVLALSPDELPQDFVYPLAFESLLQQPLSKEALEPWGISASIEANTLYSEQFQIPLVQFAQAWHEDMIACFVVGSGNDPKVVVINPWAQTCENGEWTETGAILEQIANFAAWLEWVQNSDLVRLYAEHRIEQQQR